MSKVLYAISRNASFDEETRERLVAICTQLEPDNIEHAPNSQVRVEPGLAYAVTMRNEALNEDGMSLLLGFLYEEIRSNWMLPKQSRPDGNYVLFRATGDQVEVVSDYAGSRTVWFYHDDELFLASTSQRAIILFLGTFSFNEKVLPWMLSTGSLGPEFSWDTRLRRLRADSAVLLHRKSWSLSVCENSIKFSVAPRSQEKHKAALAGAIRRTIRSFEFIDLNRWVLPLSGGYDSRAILCFLKEQLSICDEIKTVTWGLRGSLGEPRNDASVARELASSLDVEHEYCYTDISTEPLEVIVDRFLLCGEGRVDHLSGYMDGMAIWGRFYDANLVGIIRGDEGFGWVPVLSGKDVRLSVDCALCEDYENLKHAVEEFGLPAQALPADLHRRNGETLAVWRDRLYHAYRIPTVLSALADIKFSYVEQCNPLLSKSILSVVRSLPDELRTNKKLFRGIVNTVSPDVPFATKNAIADPKIILSSERFGYFLKSQIRSEYAIDLLGKDFVEFIADGISIAGSASESKVPRLKRHVASMTPRLLKEFLRSAFKRPRVDGNVLAFRILIVVKMHKLLSADALRFRG